MFVLLYLSLASATTSPFNMVSNAIKCDFQDNCGFGPIIISVQPGTGDSYDVAVQPNGLVNPVVSNDALSWEGTTMLQTFEGDASIIVTMPSDGLKHVQNSGSSTISVFEGFDFSSDVTFMNSGSGETQVQEVKGGNIDFKVLGSGGANLFRVSGSKLRVIAQGSGSAYAQAESAIETDVTVSGSGGATIILPKDSGSSSTIQLAGSGGLEISGASTIDGVVSGSGSLKVYYTGSKPTVNVDSSGSGGIDYEESPLEADEQFDNTTVVKYKPALNYAPVLIIISVVVAVLIIGFLVYRRMCARKEEGEAYRNLNP